MDLLIMGLNDATEYIPIKPTYAPRIFSSFSPDMAEDFPLINSKNYMAIRDYVFDDNDSSYEAGPVWINGDIAKKIIQEYQKYVCDAEQIMHNQFLCLFFHFFYIIHLIFHVYLMDDYDE